MRSLFHFSLHLGERFKTQNTGHVDGKLVPMPRFGLVLNLTDWRARLASSGRCFS